MGLVVGIDLGGTSIYGGLINDRGQIIKRVERWTGDSVGKEEVLDQIGDIVKELIQGENVLGVGIGSPGFIDSKEGRVLKIAGNIEDWAYTNIKDELSKRIPGYKIYVENDANVAGLCEGWIGAGEGLDSFLMITLGTGVGGAIYTKKEGIWAGRGYQGGEFGHSILYPKGRPCKCGQNGCVERYISGNAVERIYAERTGEEKSGKEIFTSRDIDVEADQVVEEFCQNLATFIVSLKNMFDPQAIIIGGGVINSKEYWWEKTMDYYEKYSNDPTGMKIVPAKFFNDSGMIGAGKVVFNNLD